MSALVRFGVWLALLVAAAGVGLTFGSLGLGLVAGGLATAGCLLFVVNLPEPEAKSDPALDDLGRRRDRSDRRWPA